MKTRIYRIELLTSLIVAFIFNFTEIYGQVENSIGDLKQIVITRNEGDKIDNSSRQTQMNENEKKNRKNTDEVFEWNGKDWMRLGSIMNKYENSYVQHKGNTYEAGSYVLSNGSAISYYRKSDAKTIVKDGKRVLELRVYPNPFVTFTTLYIPATATDGNEPAKTFILYNLLGEEVKRIENIHTQEIKIYRDNLSEGIYPFKIMDSYENIYAGKLVIQ